MMYTLALLFLPGTIIHEMSHWLMATILLVHTGKITLWPEIHDQGIKMGSVEIAKTDIIRRTLIGVAPFLIGLVLIFGSLHIFTQYNLFTNGVVLLATGLLIFQIGNTMFSSKKDLEGTWMFLLIVLAIISGLYLLGVRVDPNSILTPSFIDLVKKANLFLIAPLILDLLLVLFLKIF